MTVSKKSSKKLMNEVKSFFGNNIELSNGNIVNLSLKKGMIIPNKSMGSQFRQTPYVGSYSSSSSANTNKTHLWASPNFNKLQSFRFALDSVAPQIVDARAKRFNTITDESDTDNFVVFNQNRKGKRQYIDDTILYLDHGSSTFVFNTEFADINIGDPFSTTSVPQIETNATVFLGEETRASIEWWDDMSTSTDRKQIDIYGFNENDFIETRYIDSGSLNYLDYKLEQDGGDVVIKYRNNLSANANDDSLYSVLRLKSVELDEIEDQISDLPYEYNLEPVDQAQNDESEIAEPPPQELDYDAILLYPGVSATIDSFDAGDGKITILKSAFGLTTVDDPVIKFVGTKNQALALADTDADFVYAKKNGLLYFNENESLQGWGAGGEILELTEKPKLVLDNFQFFDF